MASKQSVKPFRTHITDTIHYSEKENTRLNGNKTHSHAQVAALQVYGSYFTDY